MSVQIIRPGRSGGLPPRPSHRSVRAQLRHTARPVTVSLRGYHAPVAGATQMSMNSHQRRLLGQLRYPLLSRAHGSGARCLRHVALQRFRDLTPPSLHGAPVGRVPPFHRYYEAFRLPAGLPAALRFLRLAVPSRAPAFVSPFKPDAGLRAWSIGSGCSAPAVSRWSRRVSQVPGQPAAPMPGSPTPAGQTRQAMTTCPRGPPL